MEKQIVTGIAFSKDEAKITLRHVADKPGVAAAIFVPLADANINVDMIIQNVSDDGATTDITFTVPRPITSARGQGARSSARRRSAMPSLQGDAMSRRSRRSASACAAMPASPPRFQGAGREGHQHPARSPPRRSSSRC